MVRLTKYSKDLTDFEKELLLLKKYHFPCGNKYGIAIDQDRMIIEVDPNADKE